MSSTKERMKVRKAIQASGLKVKHLALKIGVSSGHLSSYLTGKRNLGLPAKTSLFRELNLSDEAPARAS